jgi:glutathione S-transferase
MKLLYARPSPFARKVRVLIHERDLQNQVEEIATAPYDSPPELIAVNPASKVPALQLNDGSVLIESNLIATYLDHAGAHPPLLPRPLAVRALQCWGRAEGLTMAAWLIVVEGRRDNALQSASWKERQRLAISRTLDALEADAHDLPGALHYAHIVLGVALGYIDFRLPEESWRAVHPRLADWYATFSQRPSMLATTPN